MSLLEPPHTSGQRSSFASPATGGGGGSSGLAPPPGPPVGRADSVANIAPGLGARTGVRPGGVTVPSNCTFVFSRDGAGCMPPPADDGPLSPRSRRRQHLTTTRRAQTAPAGASRSAGWRHATQTQTSLRSTVDMSRRSPPPRLDVSILPSFRQEQRLPPLPLSQSFSDTSLRRGGGGASSRASSSVSHSRRLRAVSASPAGARPATAAAPHPSDQTFVFSEARLVDERAAAREEDAQSAREWRWTALRSGTLGPEPDRRRARSVPSPYANLTNPEHTDTPNTCLPPISSKLVPSLSSSPRHEHMQVLGQQIGEREQKRRTEQSQRLREGPELVQRDESVRRSDAHVQAGHRQYLSQFRDANKELMDRRQHQQRREREAQWAQEAALLQRADANSLL